MTNAFADVDVWRAANMTIELYAADAGWNAGLRADALYNQGDMDGFRAWVRIAAAINDLQNVEPNTKDLKH